MMRRVSFVGTVLVGLSVPAHAWAVNAVVVQSKVVSRKLQGVPVGISLTNEVSLTAFVIPLEIRTVTGGAFVTALGMSTASNTRFYEDSTTLIVNNQYADPGATSCRWGPTRTYSDGQVHPVIAPPEAVMLVRLNFGSGWAAGVDATPSLILTLNMNDSAGCFVIDTTCVYPTNHLTFLDMNTNNINPPELTFTAGNICIGENLCPVDAGTSPAVSGIVGQTLSNLVTAADLEKDPISYFQVSGPGATDAVTGEWFYTPSSCSEIGTYTVKVEVTDKGRGNCGAPISFSATVTAPPLLVSAADLLVACGNMVEDTVHASGGCPPHTYALTGGPGTLGSSGVWSYLPPCREMGCATVHVLVTDAIGQQQAVAFSLSVLNNVMDLNCNGVPDVLDVVMLINVVFRGGQLPPPCMPQ